MISQRRYPQYQGNKLCEMIGMKPDAEMSNQSTIPTTDEECHKDNKRPVNLPEQDQGRD
jgi:hypothetical protein